MVMSGLSISYLKTLVDMLCGNAEGAFEGGGIWWSTKESVEVRGGGGGVAKMDLCRMDFLEEVVKLQLGVD
ncbi:hypothetical protein HPP92_020573 [Vanilla planifolia]|uniref:Uncharacterized protein n=1 Tax=Vanilla planifolia TaxID=51239 RepID=A0A835Q7I0_VANPL|nr:hypothetical protein HPP92_020573 [Vanilla planifolia]